MSSPSFQSVLTGTKRSKRDLTGQTETDGLLIFLIMDFETFWELFSPDTCFLNRFEAARKAWDNTPADKQQAIIAWLRQHGAYKKRNPYFFILDFRPQSAEPTDMNGRALKQGVQYVTAKYNGKWGTYETDYSRIDPNFTTELDDVLIWTGVTNNPAYKSTHIVMRHIKCKNVQWTMGDPSTLLNYSSAAPECQVVLTNDFWISVFPITIGQWTAVGLGSNGRSNGGSSYYPANTNDCAIQVNSMLAARNGIPGSGTQTTKWPDNRHSVDSRSLLGRLRVKTGYDFELPTEAQWEFAARGGVYGLHLYTGEITDTGAKLLNALQKIAWFDANCKVSGNIYRKPVGCLKPNAYGLYDVLGMLAEYMLNRDYDYDTEHVAFEPEGSVDGNYMFRSYTYANSYTGMRVGNRRLGLSSNSFVGVRVILPDFPGLVYPAWDKQ